jgi:internalin A
LVKADVQDKKVFISVAGPVTSRRRLLAIIRSHFEEIHLNFKKLKVEAMVPLSNYPDVVVPYSNLLVREERGSKQFDEVVGDLIIQINVNELLNGVDFPHSLQTDKGTGAQTKPAKLFYSYSHRDERLRERLETHLHGVAESWVYRNMA